MCQYLFKKQVSLEEERDERIYNFNAAVKCSNQRRQIIWTGGIRRALPGVSLDLDPEGCLPKTEELEKAFFTERTECVERSEERGLGGV